MITFTDEEKSLLTYIDSLIPPDGNLVFDFNDPRQYRAAVLITEKSFDTVKYPGKLSLLRLIKETQEKKGPATGTATAATAPTAAPAARVLTDTDWTDKIAIPGLGLTTGQPANVIASNGIATATGGYTSMNLSLIVQDKTSGNIVASGANHDLAGTLLTVKTNLNPGLTDTNVKASLYYSYSKTGAAAENFSGVVRRDNANGLTTDPVLTAPVRTTINPIDPNALNIGLGRPWANQGGNSGLDYAWNEPTQDHPVGKIPFVGSVVFPQAIKPLVQGTTIILDIYVANQTNGGTVTLNPTNWTNVYANFTIDTTNPNKLNWNLPPGQSTSQPGNPISFDNVSWPSNLEAIFYCGITVVLQDGSLGYAAIQSQTTGDEDPLDGILGIMPISFIWHCLGENTSVIMADGSAKPIAAIVAGDKVRTDDQGAAGIVEWTNKGAHFGQVLHIATQNGKEIIASHNHVFISKNGPVAADELKPGDILEADGGQTAITKIKVLENYPGQLYNLAIRNLQGLSTFTAATRAATTAANGDGRSGRVNCFFANGYRVGDSTAQKGLEQFRSNNIDWVKKRVPEYLHQDVDAFFEEKIKTN